MFLVKRKDDLLKVSAGPHWKALYLEWHSWKQMSRTCQIPGWMSQEMEAERGAGTVEHYDENVRS